MYDAGGSFLTGVTSSLSPLYFIVRQQKEVMSTEQPCDLAYELGDGLFDIHDYPQGFPKPGQAHFSYHVPAAILSCFEFYFTVLNI